MAFVTGGAKAGQRSQAPGQPLRPSQVQTACLAPRYGSVRAGRLPTAPSQQTIISALLRGAQAAGTSTGDSQGRPLPSHPPPGNGQCESQRLDIEIPDAKQRQAEGSGWEIKGRGWAGWSEVMAFLTLWVESGEGRVRPPQLLRRKQGWHRTTRRAVLSTSTKAQGSLSAP